ncbi:hypothetical protein D8674_000048 [Pyrus ussuriensis x Pyrus communis]|uniref:Secreted protein n=1 Tax=Pyrus ussuriensis x Pyrus communis TaxID=2448454 RepID=A0A5N5F1Y6_9ROSA|nr:hypothetical protein D8674_000048 [Pyrus ussuriensis x Pyrus communis]
MRNAVLFFQQLLSVWSSVMLSVSGADEVSPVVVEVLPAVVEMVLTPVEVLPAVVEVFPRAVVVFPVAVKTLLMIV